MRGVFASRALQPLEVIGFHAAVVISPAIIGFAQQNRVHISDCLAFTKKTNCVTKFSEQPVPVYGAFDDYSSYGPFSPENTRLWTQIQEWPSKLRIFTAH